MVAERRRSRKQRNGEMGKLFVGTALTTVALIAVTIGLYVYLTTKGPPLRDQATFCPLDGPTAITVVLLDNSDPLPRPAKEQVLKLLGDIVDEMPEYALLEVRVLEQGPLNPELSGHTSGRQVFSLCNPGDGRGLNEFTGNPALAKKKWKERFREPLDRVLSANLTPQPSKISPLLATFQGIAVERFTGKAVEKIPKSMIVVSDMIENTREYTQYPSASRVDLSYQRYKKSSAYLKYRTDLQGADVWILRVPRLPPSVLDPLAHIQFWVDWVQDNRGHFLKAIRLQG
jgi:hypothetical protein